MLDLHEIAALQTPSRRQRVDYFATNGDGDIARESSVSRKGCREASGKDSLPVCQFRVFGRCAGYQGAGDSLPEEGEMPCEGCDSLNGR